MVVPSFCDDQVLQELLGTFHGLKKKFLDDTPLPSFFWSCPPVVEE